MNRQSRRVLIADNHELIRRGVRTLLETRPNLHVVAEASDGRMALEEAQITAPDIAIVGFSLPGLNGLDLTTALKRELPQVEVLIHTRFNREELIREALRAGAKGYVLKSDPEEQLLKAVEALSVHRRYVSDSISETLLERLEEMPTPDQSSLTHREREVVQLIAEGRLNKQVAGALSLSIKTVECHRARAMQKLNLRNTAQLVRYALRNNIAQV